MHTDDFHLLFFLLHHFYSLMIAVVIEEIALDRSEMMIQLSVIYIETLNGLVIATQINNAMMIVVLIKTVKMMSKTQEIDLKTRRMVNHFGCQINKTYQYLSTSYPILFPNYNNVD